jgi:hypothetical protein
MRDASDVVNAYLTGRFGFGLERLLADATAGRPAPALAGSVIVACDPVGGFEYEDGGSDALYQGLLTIEGVVYRFRCSVFTDAGGARFLESVGELEIVRWGVRLVVPAPRQRARSPAEVRLSTAHNRLVPKHLKPCNNPNRS